MTDDEKGPEQPTPPGPPQTWPVQPPTWGTPPAAPPVGPPVGAPPPPPPPAWAYPADAPTQPFGPPAPTAELPPWGAPASAPGGPSTGRTVAIILGVTAALTVAVIAAGLVLWQPWSRPAVVGSPLPGPPPGGAQPPGPPQPPGDLAPPPAPPEPTLPPKTLRTDAAKTYVANANTFCRETTDPALKKAFGYSRTDPQRFLTEVARINRELDTYLRKNVPAEISDNVAGITRDWDTFAAEYENAAKAFSGGDVPAAAERLAAGEAANRDGNAKARQIGLSDCADAGGIGGAPGGGGTPGVPA